MILESHHNDYTIETIYPKSFDKSRLNEIAEFLSSIQVNIVEFLSMNYPDNNLLKSISSNLFRSMNKTCIKISKCDSESDVYMKLCTVLNQSIEQKRPGHGSPRSKFKMTYERSEVRYINE